MKNVLACVAVIAAMSAMPVLAEPAARSDGDRAIAAPTKSAAGRRYCFEDVLTGSRTPIRVCKSRAEWKANGVDVDNPRKD